MELGHDGGKQDTRDGPADRDAVGDDVVVEINERSDDQSTEEEPRDRNAGEGRQSHEAEDRRGVARAAPLAQKRDDDQIGRLGRFEGLFMQVGGGTLGGLGFFVGGRLADAFPVLQRLTGRA